MVDEELTPYHVTGSARTTASRMARLVRRRRLFKGRTIKTVLPIHKVKKNFTAYIKWDVSVLAPIEWGFLHLRWEVGKHMVDSLTISM